MSVGFLPKPRIERHAEDVYFAALQAGMSPGAPVNVEYIVEFVLEYDLHQGASLPPGVLGATNGRGRTVLISDDIPNVGRRRFTIAHEIGHISLHLPFLMALDEQPTLFDRPAGPAQDDQMEWQADYFAGALLMPRMLLVELYGEAARSGEAIDPGQVADTFEVSRQAAGIRLGEVGLLRGSSPGAPLIL